MVAFIKTTMNIECRLVVAWVNSGGPEEMEQVPAWIRMPTEMPLPGTAAFRELKLTMFIRKSFLEKSTFDQVVICVAHELSHVVLNSLNRPLRRCERAVDLTAMLLGFRRLYATGSHTEHRSQNRTTIYELGYLAPYQVWLADQILSQGQTRPKIKAADSLRAMMATLKFHFLLSA